MQSFSDKDFYISDHAKRRLKERLGVSDKKILKVTRKAWEQNQKDRSLLSKKFMHKEYNTHFKKNRVVKELMGYAFVFGVGEKKKILITVI